MELNINSIFINTFVRMWDLFECNGFGFVRIWLIYVHKIEYFNILKYVGITIVLCCCVVTCDNGFDAIGEGRMDYLNV